MTRLDPTFRASGQTREEPSRVPVRCGTDRLTLHDVVDVARYGRMVAPLEQDVIERMKASAAWVLQTVDEIVSARREGREPAAYYGIIGDLLDIIRPHSEADEAALIVQFLIAIGNLITRCTYFVAQGTRHYLNLFACLVGATSRGRKGSSSIK